MPVRKRGDVWWIGFTFRGQRVRASAGKGATKEQALELEAKLLSECHASRMGRKPDRLISEGILKWLDVECKGLKSGKSMESHARALLPFVKGKTFAQIQLVAEDVKRSMKLEHATVNRRLAVLRRVANLAYDSWGWLDVQVGRRVKLFKERNARHFYLTPKEVNDLAANCKDGRVKQIVMLAAYTGLRRGEILKLTNDNLVDGCIVLRGDTKSGKPRLVPLPLGFEVDLPIQINVEHLRRDFEQAREAIGKPFLHFHDLRHSYASWLVQSGAGLTAVRDLLGHSNLSVTSRYAHLSPDHLKEAVARISWHDSGTVSSKSPLSRPKSLIGARDRSRTDMECVTPTDFKSHGEKNRKAK